MKKLACAIFVLSLTSCSTLKVTYDYDSQADFSRYKTYAFSEDALNLPIQQLNRDRVLRAIDTEMAAKGFTKSDSPDVLIDLHARSEQKTEATATTTGSGMYGRGWRYGYGGGFTTTQVNVSEYTVGTLFVNMVDKASEKIVWQGRATKTLSEDVSPEKREANINNGVKQIFAKYPPAEK